VKVDTAGLRILPTYAIPHINNITRKNANKAKYKETSIAIEIGCFGKLFLDLQLYLGDRWFAKQGGTL